VGGSPLNSTDPLGLQQTAPADPEPFLPSPNPGPTSDFGPAANDPAIEPEGPGAAYVVEACIANPVVCGATLLVLPRDAGGPQDEAPPKSNVIKFPGSKPIFKECPPGGGSGGNWCAAEQARLTEEYTLLWEFTYILQDDQYPDGYSKALVRQSKIEYNRGARLHNSKCPANPVPLFLIKDPLH
jgi:hypothetical protein